MSFVFPRMMQTPISMKTTKVIEVIASCFTLIFSKWFAIHDPKPRFEAIADSVCPSLLEIPES